MKLPKRVGWVVGICFISAVLALVGLRAYRITPPRIFPDKYQQILEEITSVDYSIGSLTPDPTGSVLAYVHSTEQGRGLSVIDLKTSKILTLDLTNEVTQVSGWSPDGRYLAFTQTLPINPRVRNKFKLREAYLTLFDRIDHSVRRSTADENVMENYLFWMAGNKYFYASRKLTNEFGELMLGDLAGSPREKISNYVPEIVKMSDGLAGYAYKGNIYTLELKPLRRTEKGLDEKSRVVKQLSDFKTNSFETIKWLRYSPETSNFLFCATPSGSNWRFLYQFDPNKQVLTQLSTEDTYNGQWLQQGTGFAYVVNTNNGFYLAVRGKGALGNTNLFTEGGAVNYTVAPDGDHIFITGSERMEPQGIWEYNVTTHNLHLVKDGMNVPFAAGRSIKPEVFKIKSFDGLEIPCFLFTPPGVSREAKTNQTTAWKKFGSQEKYPAVIYVPPTSSQFQKSFDERSQLLANLGFYFLAVNYRGCDGYGQDFSSAGNLQDSAKDILAAYEELTKSSKVDKEKIFLCTISGGSEVVFELLATQPKLWRGVALDKPSSCRTTDKLNPHKLPPLLLITADEDPAYPEAKLFQSWAVSNKVEISYIVHTNAGHFTFKLNERRDKLNRTAYFLMTHLN